MATGRSLAHRSGLAAVAALLCLSLLGAPAAAWDNAEAHPMINRAAVDRFLRQIENEGWWSNCSFSDTKPLGREVMDTGLLDRREELSKKTITEWLVHGGYSADTPELPQSFRHFYDPLQRAGARYLTDHLDDVLEFGWGIGKVMVKGVGWVVSLPDTENPKTDARDWALSHPDNPYSLAMAVSYFRDALQKDQLLTGAGVPAWDIIGYGQAWRAVGETMHLMADMTMPSHVRNDSHPYLAVSFLKIGNPDFFESTSYGKEVEKYLDFTPSPAIDYRTPSLSDLFNDVATWTNGSFFSCDTIPMTGPSGLTMNGQPEYKLPVLPAEHKGGYFHAEIDGISMPVAATSLLLRLNILSAEAVGGGFPLAKLDSGVIEAYRARTVPTAVEACAQVLDRFLPRFAVEVAAEPGPEDQGGFSIQGRLVHTATAMWSSVPGVRNGAYVTLKPKSGSPATIWLPSEAYGPDSKVDHLVAQGETGDEIILGWDLGGYRIESDPLPLKGLAVTLVPERIADAEPGEELILLARATDVPATLKAVQFVWKIGDEVVAESGWLLPGEGAAQHICRPAFDVEGNYQVKVELRSMTKPEAVLASAVSTITVAEPQIEAVIYPRPSQVQSNVELRFTAYPAGRYTYRWDFGDGTTLSGDSSGATHIYRKEGTVTVKLEVVTPPERGGKVVGQDTLTVRVVKDIVHDCGLGIDYSKLTKIDQGTSVWYEDAAGVKQGVHITWRSADDRAADRKASMGCYKDGLRQGMWLFWHSTGPASAPTSTGVLREETHYVDGKKHGPHATYTFSGQLERIGEYQNDVPWGYWVRYNSKGVKSEEGHYEGGWDRQGLWMFYESRGYLTRESHFVNGTLHGRSTVYNTWSDKGEVKVGVATIEYYVTGKKHGPYTAYNWVYGVVTAQGEYYEGKEHGTWRYYTSDKGLLSHVGDWHHGKRVGTWIYYHADGRESRREEYGGP